MGGGGQINLSYVDEDDESSSENVMDGSPNREVLARELPATIKEVDSKKE